MNAPLQFPADYREEVALVDGTRVSLRLIRPDDKGRLLEILGALSAHSRTMRFFVARSHISEHELRYLTELDFVDHFAILAQRGDESVGVARFVRQKSRAEVAEPALAVIDSLHARGLGRILFGRLVAAARERGIVELEAEVLRRNRAMLRLLVDFGATVPLLERWSESVTCRLDLAGARSPAAVAPPPAQRRVA